MRKGLDYKEESLTKENFWNELYEKFPKGTQVFCDWIDKYKEAVNWEELFAPRVKFHDVPYEMQMGIWIAFVKDIDEHYWEIEDLRTFNIRDHIWEYISYLEQGEKRKEYLANLTPEQRQAEEDDDLPW